MPVAVAAGVALVVGAGLIGFASAAPESSGQPVPVTMALLSADGRTLSVSRSAPCLPAAMLTAQESAATVRLTLTTLPHTEPCSGSSESRTYPAALRRPLAGRALLDTTSGRRIPVFDANDFLHPAFLPPGYTHIYDAAGYPSPDDDWDVACSQLFADASGDQLWLTQSYGERWPDGWTAADTSIAVHHTLGRSRPGMIAWRQDGESFLLTDPRLSAAQLTAIADSLRHA